jgi:hypothetical protein
MRFKKSELRYLNQQGFYDNDLLTIQELAYTFQYKGKAISFAAIKRMANDKKDHSFAWEDVLVSIGRSAFIGAVQFGRQKCVVVASWNREWLQ